MQLRAFYLIYKMLGENEEYTHAPLARFVAAIVRTSDDRMEAVRQKDPTAVDRWFALYQAENRPHRRSHRPLPTIINH